MKTNRFFILTAITCIASLFSVDLAYAYHPVSPYAYCNGNPIKYVDPDGEYWYSYNETYTDDDGNEQTRTQYAYNEQKLSRKEMRAMGYDKNIGLVAVKDGEYLSLEGGRVDTNDAFQTIETMQGDFGQMGYQDASSHMNVADSYLLSVSWNGSLPSTVDLAGQMYVVGTAANHYVNVGDRGLNSEFNAQLRANGQEPRFHAVNAPNISGTIAMVLDWAVMNSYAPPITGYSRMNNNIKVQYDRNRGNRLIQYYRRAGIIR